MSERFTPSEVYEAAKEKEPRGSEKFHEQATVNGTEISVGWDRSYQDYTIYLPQIQLGEKASKMGVHDQVLRLTRRPEVAKKVFEKAVELAKEIDDPYELYLKIEEFSSGLPYDTDEDKAQSQAKVEEKAGPDTSYYEASTVNGTEISIGWDRSYQDYTIYLPQIQLGEKASKMGVHDQVLRLTRRPEVAKKVFEKATELAKATSDPYELYLKIEKFSRGLPYDEE